MSQQNGDISVELIDQFLDLPLDQDERERLLQRIRHSPRLHSLLQRQQAIDAALTRRFTSPDQQHLHMVLDRAFTEAGLDLERVQHGDDDHTAGEQVAGRIGSSFTALRIIAATAASIAIVFGLWLTWTAIQRQMAENPVGEYVQQPRTLIEQYEFFAAHHFEPDWECRTDEEFRRTFTERLGQPLQLGDLPTGTGMSGLSYCHVFSSHTLAMLGFVDGVPVVVFVDQKAAITDSNAGPPTGPDVEAQVQEQFNEKGLNVFQRDLGDLLLYEISPLDEPRLIPHMFNPQTK